MSNTTDSWYQKSSCVHEVFMIRVNAAKENTFIAAFVSIHNGSRRMWFCPKDPITTQFPHSLESNKTHTNYTASTLSAMRIHFAGAQNR